MSAKAESLKFSDLRVNEAIVIGYASAGCFHFTERKYVVRGGARLRFEIYERKSEEYGGSPNIDYTGPERHLASSDLTEQEVFGLESYWYYLHVERDGYCSTVDSISIGYYRNGKRIGEERIFDGSCALQIHRENGKVVRAKEAPAGIPVEVYKAIIPPWLVEERIIEAQQITPAAVAN